MKNLLDSLYNFKHKLIAQSDELKQYDSAGAEDNEDAANTQKTIKALIFHISQNVREIDDIIETAINSIRNDKH